MPSLPSLLKRLANNFATASNELGDLMQYFDQQEGISRHELLINDLSRVLSRVGAQIVREILAIKACDCLLGPKFHC